jgi:hypothetical protein
MDMAREKQIDSRRVEFGVGPDQQILQRPVAGAELRVAVFALPGRDRQDRMMVGQDRVRRQPG